MAHAAVSFNSEVIPTYLDRVTKKLQGRGIRWRAVCVTIGPGAFSNYKTTPKGCLLQRLFSTFPNGWPGAGLLLLRATVGVAFVAQGIAYMASWHNLRPVTWGISLLELTGGLFLLVGYLSPIAGVLMGIICVGSALSWFQPPDPNFLDTAVTIALATSNAVAIAWLGPGAFSIDARLFGRREIVIPDVSDLSNS